jgi:hypothetical protein
MWLALSATLLAIWLRVATALSEIVVRTVATSLLRTASIHIALSILAATFGLGLIFWARSASG